MENKIFILLGASGSGKSELSKVFKEYEISELISHTTRKKRVGENENVYHFVDKNEFDKVDFIEKVVYSSNHYGLSKDEVEAKLMIGDVFTIMDAVGVSEMKKLYGDRVKVIYVYTPMSELKKRMLTRGDDEVLVDARLNHAVEKGEMNNFDIADLTIYNMSLEIAKQSLREFITPTIYIDLDEVVFKSVERFVEIYNVLHGKNCNYRKVYDYDFSPAISGLSSIEKTSIFNTGEFYLGCDLYEDCRDVINKLNEVYNIKFLTLGTHCNNKNKISVIENLFPNIPIINQSSKNVVMRKHFINYGFRDILIDDVESNLITSGCPNKLLFAPNGEKAYNRNFRGLKCCSWKDIYNILKIEGEGE